MKWRHVARMAEDVVGPPSLLWQRNRTLRRDGVTCSAAMGTRQSLRIGRSHAVNTSLSSRRYPPPRPAQRVSQRRLQVTARPEAAYDSMPHMPTNLWSGQTGTKDLPRLQLQ